MNRTNESGFHMNRRNELGFLMNKQNEPGFLMNRKYEPRFLLNILWLRVGQPMNACLRACQASSGAGQPNWLSVLK
jgi:hypothetical protein